MKDQHVYLLHFTYPVRVEKLVGDVLLAGGAQHFMGYSEDVRAALGVHYTGFPEDIPEVVAAAKEVGKRRNGGPPFKMSIVEVWSRAANDVRMFEALRDEVLSNVQDYCKLCGADVATAGEEAQELVPLLERSIQQVEWRKRGRELKQKRQRREGADAL